MMNYYEAFARIAKLEAGLRDIVDVTERWENSLVSQVNEMARNALLIAAVTEADDDGQPTEMQEWRDYDEAC